MELLEQISGFVRKELTRRPSCPFSSCRRHGRWYQHPSGGAQPTVSMTPPCPTRSQPGMGCQAHHRPNGILELIFY